MKLRYFLKPVFFIFLIFVLTGCGSFGVYNAATGRKEFIAISTPREIQMGADIHKDFIKQNKICEDRYKVDRLWRIGERLAQVSDRQDFKYHFYLVEKDELNAFTTPGGNIYFYTGLFDKLKTDDEIAAVLAHEIGHCAAKHTVKKFQAALGYSLLSNIVFEGLRMDSSTKQVTSIGTNLAMSIVFSAYSRHDEYQADELGVKYMYLAGYDLNGMVEVLQLLQREAEKGHAPVILRTHPYASDRVVAVRKEIEAVKRKYGRDS